MRFVIGALVCLGAGGISAALADPVTPPAAPAATSTPAASTQPKQSAPAPVAPAADAQAATPAANAKSATPAADTKTVLVQGKAEEDALEKHFLSEGYKIEMHNGEKLFCRREDVLGSRLGSHKNCGTAQQLSFTEQEAKAAVQRGQSQQSNPSTH